MNNYLRWSEARLKMNQNVFAYGIYFMFDSFLLAVFM